MFYDVVDSPVGALTISTDGTYITGLHIEGDRYFTHIPANWTQDGAHPLLRQARRELAEYFAGSRKDFELPILLQGTSFQRAVWQALQQVTAGATTTYKAIAQKIGKPKAVRAVGTALGRNPICIVIPCHRVLASDGTFGGYAAGISCKQQLLDIEQIWTGEL